MLQTVKIICLLGLLLVPSLGFSATNSTSATSDGRFEALKRFSQVLDMIERYYVDETDRKDLVNGAIKGMLQALDPHSTLLGPEDFKEMQEVTSGEFFGIGVEITQENMQLMVVAPIEDTPAYKAGLKPGDFILAINGKPTAEMSLQEAVGQIRGPKGTNLELTILHKDSKTPQVINLKRDSIPLISVKSRELEPGYHWIRLTRFSERTTSDLLDALKDAAKKTPIQGVILDLRNNPGGLVDQAISVSDVFLNNGVIMSMRGKAGDMSKEYKAKAQATDITAPVVVLVNAGSASASEIVAGALGDQKRAVLVGERTFGKGSVQNIIPMSDGSGLKLTIALYYTPSGKSIQAEGIVPDLEIPFEPAKDPKDDAPAAFLRMMREKDLNKHLEQKNTEAKPTATILPEAKEFLDKDNQLRMALQLVRNMKKFKELN